MLSKNAMDRVRRSGLRRRSGGAVLEMALTLTLLFSLCFGMIEFGFFFFVKNTMENAAREGCRAGIVSSGTNTTVNQAIINQLYYSGLLGTGAVPTATSTIGAITATVGSGGSAFTTSYTVALWDLTTNTQYTDVTQVPVNDTLEVKLSAVWGTVGQDWRPWAIIGGSSGAKTIICATSMRKEG
jgi:Flp pilus assembly protein TadG